MPHYQVLDADEGVVYAYVNAERLEFEQWPEPPYRQREIAEPPPAPPPPVYYGRRLITRLEFLRLFTAGERIAVRKAAESNAELADFMQLLDMADEVNLDSDDTIKGVTMLEKAKLLGLGRAAGILRG